MSRQNLYDLSLQDLQDWVETHDLKPFAVTQMVQWLYDKRVDSIEEMSNVSKTARTLLLEQFSLPQFETVQTHVSTDASLKFVHRLTDGEMIESVLMPQARRITLCVSSQVGCAMGCTFCKTAEMKLKRQLSQGEILGQVLAAFKFMVSGSPEAKQLQDSAETDHISNIVFMGMGEPLHNLDAVVEAVRILLDQRAFNFSRKKITVSTSGLAPQIVQFAKEVPARLAVSLNASNDRLRTEIMPINRRHDLQELLAACKEYARLSGGMATLEYVLLRDLNDTLEHAAELVRLISKTPCKLNLIPFNPYPGSPYKRPEEERIKQFHTYLADRGFQVNIRYSKGLDVLAACGQLATDSVRQVA